MLLIKACYALHARIDAGTCTDCAYVCSVRSSSPIKEFVAALRYYTSMACRNAYYGPGKKLRCESWKGIGDDIVKRLNRGDLSDELQTLSFEGRKLTTQGWRMLEQVLPKLRKCFVLDLRSCGISNVRPLIEMMPKLVRICKCFDLGDNSLSAESVSLLVEAMDKRFHSIRPTWLAIGDDARDAACQYLHDPLSCSPHWSRGCAHVQHSVVHVVQKLSDFQRMKTVTKSFDVKVESSEKISRIMSERGTFTPRGEVIDSGDMVGRFEFMDARAAFRSYVTAQHSAVKLDMLELWSSLGGYMVAPLSIAARVAQKQARNSFNILCDSFGDSLTSFLIGENMYILAATEGRLTLIDLSESVQMGGLVDFHGRDADEATPLQNFQYVVEAEPHEAEAHELQTQGGEKLDISLQVTGDLLKGRVVCDGLWFPMHKCKV